VTPTFMTLGELPSEVAARRFIEGKPGAFLEVAAATLERAVMISVPFFFMDIDPKEVALGSLAAAAIISIFVVNTVRSQEPD